jgi:ketosteroid isomerase-like protein
MSQENVELIRRFTEAVNRGDVAGAIALANPPPEYEFVPGLPLPDIAGLRGPEAMRRAVERFWGEFDDAQVELHELIDAGDAVVGSATFHGRGKHSGADTSWGPLWGVWTVRDGRLVRWQGFTDRDAALEAAGLAGETMQQENVQVVRSAHAAFARGDLERFLALIHPDVEFTSLVVEAETGRAFRGHAGVRRWSQAVSETFRGFHAEVESAHALDPQRVIAKLRMSGVTRGMEVRQTMWQAAVVRGGKLVWWGIFRTEVEAVEAVRLQE